MTTPSFSVLIFLAAAFPLLAQPQSPPPAAGAQEQSESTGTNDRDARRERRRERWERIRNATPAERAEIRIDRMVDRATRTYDLDEMQRVMVKQEMLRIQAERRAAMGADAEEYDRLRERMFEFWSQRRDSGPGEDQNRDGRRSRRELRDNPEFRQLRDQMREFEEKYPMDWEAASERIESLLPQDQVERGRKRRQEFENRRRDRGRADDQGGRRSAPAAGTPQAENAQLRPAPEAAQTVTAQPPTPPSDARAKPQAEHPWEVYTRQFIARHELTEAQTTAAYAILQDIRNRAAQMETALADRLHEAARIRDSVSRQKRISSRRHRVRTGRMNESAPNGRSRFIKKSSAFLLLLGVFWRILQLTLQVEK